MTVKKLTIDCGYEEEPVYVPKELCGIDRFGEVVDADSCKECCENEAGDCHDCAIQRCFKMLHEYEDTGLTPEQIREIDKLYAEKCKEVAELKKITFSGMEMANIIASLSKLRQYEKLEAKGKLFILSDEEAEKDCEACICGNCDNKDSCCPECTGLVLKCEGHKTGSKDDEEEAGEKTNRSKDNASDM